MISETARSHGSFFIMLFEHLNGAVKIEKMDRFGAGYYVLGECAPVYLKMSSRRKGPWTFNFFRSHQENQELLFREFGECFTCLVCGKDGVAGLSMSELRQVLDGEFEEQECVSVRRKLKGMYSVKGRDGELNNRISRRSIFDKLRVVVEKGRAI